MGIRRSTSSKQSRQCSRASLFSWSRALAMPPTHLELRKEVSARLARKSDLHRFLPHESNLGTGTCAPLLQKVAVSLQCSGAVAYCTVVSVTMVPCRPCDAICGGRDQFCK